MQVFPMMQHALLLAGSQQGGGGEGGAGYIPRVNEDMNELT